MTTIILLALALSMDAFAASLSQRAGARPSADLAGAYASAPLLVRRRPLCRSWDGGSAWRSPP